MSTLSDKRDCYAGIDIGGSTIKAGVVDAEGKIWARRQKPISHGSLSSLSQQIALVANELRAADGSFQIKGVGIGFPALVSKKKSRISISHGGR
jgi:glucokinase